MDSRRTIGVAVVLLTGTAVLAAGMAVRAAQIAAPPTFRGGVDVVHVDVTVLDRNRQPVRGLTADDFTVFEEGQPRPVVAFSAVESPAATTSSTAPWLTSVARDTATNDVAPNGRLLTILFDWTIRADDLGRARRAALAAVDALGPDDLASVVFSSGFRNGGIAQNFTPDKARLRQAINGTITTAAVDANGELLDQVEDTFAVIDTPSCRCGVCSYEKVGDAADAVANVPGRRKSLLFIGTYFPPPIPPPPPPRPFGDDGPMLVGCNSEVVAARNQTLARLHLSNLTVHVIDPSGTEALQMGLGVGRGRGTMADTGFSRQADLPFLSTETNGRHVLSGNDPERTVPSILNETSAFYVLAFPATDKARTATGRHRIEVKVRGRDLIVQARSAYRPGSTAATDAAAIRRASEVDALQATLPQADQRLLLTATALPPTTGGTAPVAIVLRVEPGSNATAQAPSGTAPRRDTINGVVMVLDSEGRVVASKKHAGDVPWAPNASRPRPYELLTRVDLPPGRYEIRALLDTLPDERSSVYGYVEVPPTDGQPLNLSGLVLGVQPSAMAAPRAAFDGLLPFLPTARRRFTADDVVTALVRVDRGRATESPLPLTARIVDTSGRVRMEQPLPDTAADRTLGVPTDTLPPGEYLLEVVAGTGASQVTRTVRFSVE